MMDIFTTMITPYHSDGSVDYDAARRYTQWYAAKGLTGIFAVCQSSEIFYLSLEERVRLNRCVYEEVQTIAANGGPHLTVVSSGHVAYDLNEQVRELNAFYDSGTDALILITNRLDPHNEGDDVFIRNAEKLMAQLPREAKLGLYECPYPYKRLVTPRILDWCLQTGRFAYMKDTCCDADILAHRCQQLQGSAFKLLNANCQTLLESLRAGGQGYCGIMCNFHPQLYVKLCQEFEQHPAQAELLQSLIGTLGFTESGLPYPLTAKYHMNLCGLPTENLARNRQADEMTDYAKHCMHQMKLATDYLEKQMEGGK